MTLLSLSMKNKQNNESDFVSFFINPKFFGSFFVFLLTFFDTRDIISVYIMNINI